MAYLLTRNRDRDFGARIRLPAGPVVVGRSARSTIRLEDRSVSKVHATIESLADGRFQIEDMGSRNGVFHEGRRRKRCIVAVGEEVRLGEVIVTFCGDGPETLPVPEPVPRPRPDDFETSIEQERAERRPRKKSARGRRATGAQPNAAPAVAVGDEAESGLWTRSERWALFGFSVAALALGAGVWWLSRPDTASRIERDTQERAAASQHPGAATGSGSGASAGVGTGVDAARVDLTGAPQLSRVAPGVTALAAISVARLKQLRHTWLLLYGRIPSVAELLAAQHEDLEALLARARTRPEFWRWRAVSRAGAQVLDDASLLSVPADWGDWAHRLSKIDGDGATPATSDAPLPGGTRDDRAYRGWLLQQLDDRPRAMTRTMLVRSAWTAAHNRPPSLPEDRVLMLEYAGGATTDQSWDGLRGAVRVIVHGAAAPLPTRVAAQASWVQGTLRWLLARELSLDEAEEVATLLSAAPGVLVEECVLSKEFANAR